jgi:hypothetical protein
MKKRNKNEKIHLVGIAGILAIIMITVIVFLFNTANINASAIIKYTPTAQNKEDLARYIYTSVPTAECERRGIEQCRKLYPKWSYETRIILPEYEECTRYVKEICGQAKQFPPNMI